MNSRVRFPLGQVVVTRSAMDTLNALDIRQSLSRHARGDWGDLCADDAAENANALVHGGRLFSAYDSGKGSFWIITESDRSVTTVLLPEDY